MKIFEYLFIILGILFLAFVAFGLQKDEGMGAVDNFCAPVNWAGNISVSMSAIIDPHSEAETKKAFTQMNYSCRYIGWRLFFEKQYEAWKKQQKLEREAGVVYPRPDTAGRTVARYSQSGQSVHPVTDGENIVNQGAPK